MLAFLQQGPNGHFADYVATNRAGILSDGNWHTVEVLLTPESSPCAGNGTYVAWVDGTSVGTFTGIQWLAAGNRVGYPFLIFDPVYGGTVSSAPYAMYWDFDQLYVSTK